MSDKTTKTDFEECYKQADIAWTPALKEMKKDLRFYEDDQLSAGEKQYLKVRRRQSYVFNLQKKIVRLLGGYERKTRLTMVVGPEDGERDAACVQHTACLMHTMNRSGARAYQIFSDAFKFGTLVTGWNLVDFWPNHNGDVDFGRRPYNKFLLDPNFTSLDLSDCQYVILGDAITKEQAKRLVRPELATEVNRAFIKGSGTGDYGLSKWPFMSKRISPYKDDLRRFEQFWRRTTKKDKFIIDKQTGQFTPLKFILRPWMTEMEKRQALYSIASQPQRYSLINRDIDSVELTVFYNGVLLETYDDPYDIDDYPFVLIAGDWQPEEDIAKLKIAPILRTTRDPCRAENRRIMQMLDMAERQITTGFKAKEGAVSNLESLYRTGQGIPLMIKKEASLEDVQEIFAKDIPPGFFALEQLASNKVMALMGISEDTFGAGEKDIPIGLWQMRQGAALTIFQEPMDNYRNARRQAGRKLVRMHQAAFSPQKVQRVTNEQLAPGFYAADFEKYDCTLQEGILTDTQRQMAYAQIVQLTQMKNADGSAVIMVPPELVLELMPIQLSQKFKKAISDAQQKKQQMSQMSTQMQIEGAKAQLEGVKAKTAVDITKAGLQAEYMQESKAEAERDRAQALLARAKAAVAIDKARLDRAMSIIDRLLKFDEMSSRRLRQTAIVRR